MTLSAASWKFYKTTVDVVVTRARSRKRDNVPFANLAPRNGAHGIARALNRRELAVARTTTVNGIFQTDLLDIGCFLRERSETLNTRSRKTSSP